MNELFLTVRRIDASWHVVARDQNLEYTHQQGFARSKDALGLQDEIRAGLDRAVPLNLADWESAPLAR